MIDLNAQRSLLFINYNSFNCKKQLRCIYLWEPVLGSVNLPTYVFSLLNVYKH